MPSSCATVPNKPQQASEIGNSPLNRDHPRPLRSWLRLSVVACSGFRPQVKLGTIGLDLTPDGESAQPDQQEQQQLLHGADPFTFAARSRPATDGRPPWNS
jgi:hypothetical protein